MFLTEFNLIDIFECGQCFRWEKNPSGSYIGIVNGKVLEVFQNEKEIIVYNINIDDFNQYYLNYFDLCRDYSEIINELSK